MKSGEDFRIALGEPTQAFIDRVHQTLNALPEKKEVKVKKAYRTVVLIAALLAVMTFALAEANAFGIRGFFRLWFGNKEMIDETALTDAQSSVALSGAAMELAEVSVREVIYDGTSLYVVTELTPKDDKTLFINMFDNELDCPMRFMDENGEMIDTGLTVAEYAKKMGYERVVCASSSIDLEGVNSGIGEKVNVPGGVRELTGFAGLDGAEALSVSMRVGLQDLSDPSGKTVLLERADMKFEVQKRESRM